MNKSYLFEGNYWTQKFNTLLDSLVFSDKRLQYSFEGYRQEIRDLEDKIEQMGKFIEEVADSERFKDKLLRRTLSSMKIYIQMRRREFKTILFQACFL